MDVKFSLPEDISEQMTDIWKKSFSEVFKDLLNQQQQQEWFTQKDAAKYANVSVNTLRSWEVSGMETSIIKGVKRYNKHKIDNFLFSYSV